MSRQVIESYRSMGNSVGALEAAEATRALPLTDTQLGEIWLTLGEIYLEQRQWGDAGRRLEEARASHPSDAGLLADLGRVRFELGEVESARRLADRAIAIDPSNRSALYVSGLSRLEQEDVTGVLFLRRVAELAPENGATQYHLGRAQELAGHLEPALESYRVAIRLLDGEGPAQAQAYYDRGLLLEKLERFDEALEALRAGHAIEETRESAVAIVRVQRRAGIGGLSI